MKNDFNVQEKNLKEEVAYLATKAEKVVLFGTQINGAPQLARYRDLFMLFSGMEQDLEKELPFVVNLSIVTLEALAKAYIQIKEENKCARKLAKKNKNKDVKNIESPMYDLSHRFFSNISATNFFRLINDVTTLRNYEDSDVMAEKYFGTDLVVKSLDSFYNRYDSIYNLCAEKGYSMLYLYEKVTISPSEVMNAKDRAEVKMLTDKKINKEFSNLPNFAKALNGDNETIRNIVAKLYVEYKNETVGKSENVQDEYYSKIKAIETHFDKIMENVLIDGSYYSIDCLYDIYETMCK